MNISNKHKGFQVARSCKINPGQESESIKLIEEYRNINRYVLLGEPGSGKTTAFITESEVCGDGYYETARDFISLDNTDAWKGKTLFIDGLDETRAGKDDARTPLDAIRSKLHKLEILRYRISCREADWYGDNDEKSLGAIEPKGEITTLTLQPLSNNDVKSILEHTPVANADVFFEQADQYNLNNLLQNPQTLNMLIEATKGGSEWPDSKKEVYKLACESLVKEFNEEHLVANDTKSYPAEELLDAAGFLYAIQLIANAYEFTISQNPEEGMVSLRKLKLPVNSPYFQVLKTRLFISINHLHYAPSHRSIGEYLAARYITKQIKQVLPVRRVLALITGLDKGVVAALRGLLAWLGSISKEARAVVIGIDPLGLVLYGDVRNFAIPDKLLLLDSLKNIADQTGNIYYHYSEGRAFSAIISPNMDESLLALLKINSYTKPNQLLSMCILDGLMHSAPAPAYKEVLLSLVRDGQQIDHLRWQALKALINLKDNETLLELIEGIRLNKIEDKSDELLVTLLRYLFPDVIPPQKIFSYLHPSRTGMGSTSYDFYWNHDFPKLVDDKDIPALLDDLASRESLYLKPAEFRDLFDMAYKLLANGLRIVGDTIPAERLYTWLGIGYDDSILDHHQNDFSSEIKTWLENHPERYLEILKIGISDIESEKTLYLASQRLRHATPPQWIGLWWLEQALAPKNTAIQNACFREAFWTLGEKASDQLLSLEFLENWVIEHHEFTEAYQSLIVCEISDWRIEHAKNRRKWKVQHDTELQEKLKYFKEHKESIADGTAPAAVLHHLASAYFEHYSNVQGKTGLERLRDFLDGDNELFTAAIVGMLKVLDRKDLPENKEIFELATKQRHHFIRLPFLTAMALRYEENSQFLDSLDDNLATKALAFWYSYGAGNEPLWLKPLSFAKPILAAKVIIEYMSAMLTGKVNFIYGHYALAHDPEYHEIAPLVVLPLLEKYPTKASVDQAACLESLLKSAIQYVDHKQLLKLIKKKLTRTSMDILQRVYLLATGMILAPKEYLAKVTSYVEQSSERINHLSSFLYSGRSLKNENHELTLPTIEMLIELLGPRSNPRWPDGGGFVTHSMHDGDYVNSLIVRLSENVSQESKQIIDHLLELTELSEWYDTLRNAKKIQITNRREAIYQHPNQMEAANTLNALSPANAFDLAAIVLDELDRLKREMHTSNLNAYTRFWNEDSYSNPTTPKVENSCRNYLAEKFKDKFSRLDIEVDPESLAADSKRTDIRLTYHNNGKTFYLPIEIKCNSNRELWTAIHNQLIPKYTMAIETQGRGMYLVLWFGADKMPSPPSGKLPKSPDELQTRLIATMTHQEQALIDVFVLDVSKL